MIILLCEDAANLCDVRVIHSFFNIDVLFIIHSSSFTSSLFEEAAHLPLAALTNLAEVGRRSHCFALM
jgi:hypothetical protein